MGGVASLGGWSALLQWSRLGISAFVFLIVAQYLPIEEIGAFAIAFAPVRFFQVVHKSGVADCALLFAKGETRDENLTALFAISLIAGAVISGSILALSLIVDSVVQARVPLEHLMQAMALIPALYALVAVSEGVLRQQMRIKALAIRTCLTQTLAGILAVWLAVNGAGGWALVAFVVVNALVGGALTLMLARWWPTTLPKMAALRRVCGQVLTISAQALISTAIQPLLQLGVGLTLGLSEAGVFQIALRFLGLLDALAISPIRFLLLPMLARHASNPALFAKTITKGFQLAMAVSGWIYLGAFCAAEQILTLFVGATHANETAAVLQVFCIYGLVNAVSMPLIQGLIATKQTQWVLARAIALLLATSVCVLPMIYVSAESTAIGATIAAALVTFGVFLGAPAELGLTARIIGRAATPSVLAGSGMVVLLSWARPITADMPALQDVGSLIVIGTAFYLAAFFLLSKLSWRSTSSRNRARTGAELQKRAVILTGHFAHQKRRANIHWLSDELRANGWHVTFITVGYSWISRLLGDRRFKSLYQPPETGLLQHDDTLTSLFRYAPIHPFSLRNPWLDRVARPLHFLFEAYWRRHLHAPLPNADLVVVESGPPVMLSALARKYAPRAALVYRVSDDVKLLGLPKFLLRAEMRHAPLFDRISMASPILAQKFQPRDTVHIDPIGIPKSLYDGDLPDPIGATRAEREVVCAGTTQFDMRAALAIAKARPSWRLHIIGRLQSAPPANHPANLIFHGELPFTRTAAFIKYADIGFAPYLDRPGVEYQTTQSNRILQYRHFGLPILGPSRLCDPDIPCIIGYRGIELDELETALRRAKNYVAAKPDNVPDWHVLYRRIISTPKPGEAVQDHIDADPRASLKTDNHAPAVGIISARNGAVPSVMDRAPIGDQGEIL